MRVEAREIINATNMAVGEHPKWHAARLGWLADAQPAAEALKSEAEIKCLAYFGS